MMISLSDYHCTVPPPNPVISPASSTVFTHSSVTLKCSVTIISAVDIPVMVSIIWTQPNGQQISESDNTIVSSDTGRATTQSYPHTFNRAQLGRYTCVATLIPLPSNSDLRQSTSQQGIAQIFTGKFDLVY